MNSCQKCKNWHDCKAPPSWFNYSEIRFCPYQCLWIIGHKETFRAGDWPVQEGNTDTNNGSHQFKNEGYFVKPELIIGELWERLKRTPGQGELLITQVEDGRTLSNLSDGARAILMYVKGKDRKRIDFRRWQRGRERPKVSKNDTFWRT